MYIPRVVGRSSLYTIIIGISVFSPHTLACNGRTILRANGVSDYEKEIILEMHNRMRQNVALGQVTGQPPAANMMEMKWDNELANKAQQWATTCSLVRHDAHRHTARFPVGQNIATTWTTKPPGDIYQMESSFAEAIGKWFKEYTQFIFGHYGHGRTGHYTQMIWGDTNLIGCGYSFYYDPSKGFTKNYVCNYGPSGNVDGHTPYIKGFPNCFVYGLSNSRKFPGLCDKQSPYYYTITNYVGR